MRSLCLFGLTCLLIICGCTSKAITPDPNVYSRMDAFDQQLVTRAKTQFVQPPVAQDFNIVVSQGSYPIGTLYRVGSDIPVDYTACLPATVPPKSALPNTFPSYTITTGVAITFGLDASVIKELTSAGLTFNDTDTLNLTIKDPSIQVLADNDLKALLSRDNCITAVPSEGAWMVRGYILGQRTFAIKKTRSFESKAGIAKVANFDVNINAGDSNVSITDDADVGFIQIISQVNPALAVVAATLAPAPVGATPAAVEAGTIVGQGAPTVSAPTVVGRVGHIYVQKDRQDTSNNAQTIVSALQGASLNVSSSVEAIDTSRMPKLAQIRYFNDSDQTQAAQALTLIQKVYPTAVLVRVSLPAPAGQLEVWLPKAT